MAASTGSNRIPSQNRFALSHRTDPCVPCWKCEPARRRNTASLPAIASSTRCFRSRRRPNASLKRNLMAAWPLQAYFRRIGDRSEDFLPMPKLLLIEDDAETANEITAEMIDRGFQVDWAASGIEGLDKARSAEPDVMIVDRLLPGMDGLTIVEALRKEEVN